MPILILLGWASRAKNFKKIHWRTMILQPVKVSLWYIFLNWSGSHCMYYFRNYFYGRSSAWKDVSVAEWLPDVLSSEHETFGLGVTVDNRPTRLYSKSQEKLAKVLWEYFQQLFDSSFKFDQEQRFQHQ